jgi:hypothetical protein
MSLSSCAPWVLEGEEHVVSFSEAETVKRLFASLSPAKAKAEAAKKDCGWLPLHCVARNAKGRYSIAVLTAIFNAYPAAAKEQTPDGHLPLHYVARHMGGDEGLQAIDLLLAEYPQAAKEKEFYGNLPIRLMCENENGATLEMVRELLSAFPKGITVGDSSGIKPYAAAAHFQFLPADAIDFLRCAEQGEPTLLSTSRSASLYLLLPSRAAPLPNTLTAIVCFDLLMFQN